ncbi:MAG: hypothetical protein K0S47_3190 [Herbinix sp.]|jgi:hypothetical protein|nr:hypothetical protein [Herbinix sp.]
MPQIERVSQESTYITVGAFLLQKRGDSMEIIKVIVDKLPTSCIACPLSTLKKCGKDSLQRGTSGSVFHEMKPDYRCLLRKGN